MRPAERRRMLAVAFGPPTMAAAAAGLPEIYEQADCVELRLDLFDEPFDLPLLLHERGDLPAVVTLRAADQGGKSDLPPSERLEVLVQAAELGAEYVDVEYDALTPAVISSMHAVGTQVIVSRHDFSGMPDLADQWWPRLAELGGDIVKVVGTARDVRDCLQVFRALSRADRPTIAIAMGAAGLISRVLALRFEQCLLTYAALTGDPGTAPGQLTIEDMRETYRAERLRSTTRVYGLLGPHAEVERVRDYNAWFDADQFDGVAVPFAADHDAADILAAFRELPVSGWHVHNTGLQVEVRSALDELRPTAERQGKVNSIVRRADGALIGDWVESPRAQYEIWTTSG